VRVTCEGAYTLQLGAQQCCQAGCALSRYQQQLRIVCPLYQRVPANQKQASYCKENPHILRWYHKLIIIHESRCSLSCNITIFSLSLTKAKEYREQEKLHRNSLF